MFFTNFYILFLEGNNSGAVCNTFAVAIVAISCSSQGVTCRDINNGRLVESIINHSHLPYMHAFIVAICVFSAGVSKRSVERFLFILYY